MDKIRWCEDQLKLAYRYLETDEGSDLHIFRPLFEKKFDANGNVLPPHKEWVKNVFIRRREKAIAKLQKLLRCVDDIEHEQRSSRRAQKRMGRKPPA